MTMAPRVYLNRSGAVATLVFANPARKNAVTIEMWRSVPPLLGELALDPNVRMLVLTGEGDTFISGADISQFADARSEPAASRAYNDAVDGAYGAVYDFPLPTLACIRGICFGGGLGLASMCDLRFATAEARFRMPAARLGVGYRYDGVRRFRDLVGEATTCDLFFSARILAAPEAHRVGFVQQVFAPADLDAGVAAYCAQVCANAPLTILAAKRALREAARDPSDRDLAAAEAMVEACFASEDYNEGRNAFRDKRAPEFRGC